MPMMTGIAAMATSSRAVRLLRVFLVGVPGAEVVASTVDRRRRPPEDRPKESGSMSSSLLMIARARGVVGAD